MKRKGQAAMEFLMTYGWAILVVLVAIGALAYFGVLSPDKFLPNRCTLPSGIACIDHKASTTGVTVILQNGLGYDLTDVNVTVANCGSVVNVGTMTNGAQGTAAPTCTLTSGAKFNNDITVAYTNSDTGLSHSLTGTITTKVE
jgi:uncharacterized protein (UPF0333 family)